MFLLGMVIFSSCKITSTPEDITLLQKNYPIVYKINETRHVVVDSVGGVYDVGMTLDGAVKYKIKIK